MPMWVSNWFQGMDKAQQATIAAAVIVSLVALTGSVLTFLRVFLERRSAKLVSRDQKRREARQERLKPIVEFVDGLFGELDETSIMLTAYADSTATRAELEPYIKNWHAIGARWAQHMARNLALGGRFPVIVECPSRLSAYFTPLVYLNEGDHFAAANLLRQSQSKRIALYVDFHKAIEHTIFGTSNIWAARVRLRREIRNAVMAVRTLISRRPI